MGDASAPTAAGGLCLTSAAAACPEWLPAATLAGRCAGVCAGAVRGGGTARPPIGFSPTQLRQGQGPTKSPRVERRVCRLPLGRRRAHEKRIPDSHRIVFFSAARHAAAAAGSAGPIAQSPFPHAPRIPTAIRPRAATRLEGPIVGTAVPCPLKRAEGNPCIWCHQAANDVWHLVPGTVHPAVYLSFFRLRKHEAFETGARTSPFSKQQHEKWLITSEYSFPVILSILRWRNR